MELVDATANVEVTEKFLETCATGTLVGTLATKFNFKVPKALVLTFPKSPLYWCQKNGGPHQYIVNEYTIQCLLDDVLKLREWGVDVKLETVIREP